MITKEIGPASYALTLPPSWKVHNMFNESLLKLYLEPEFTMQIPPLPEPPVPVVGQEDEYKVEEILDSCFYRRKLQYLIKWKGYPHEDNTWEPEQNLKNSPQVIQGFHCLDHNIDEDINIKQGGNVTNAP